MILSDQENVSTNLTSKYLWGDGLASNFINILVDQSQYVYNLYYQKKFLFENIKTFLYSWNSSSSELRVFFKTFLFKMIRKTFHFCIIHKPSNGCIR